MTLPLVVGVDGSDPSLAALDWAVDEAARHGLPLRLVYGSLWERYEGITPSAGRERPAGRTTAEHIVASAAERAARREPGVTVTTAVAAEDAVDALRREGDHAYAVVTGSRGRGELKGLVLGSVGLTVAGHARCPVIVVRGNETGTSGRHERILLGAGDLATCGAAVRFALREAVARKCALDVVRAWRRPAHQDAADPASVTGASVHEQRAAAELDALLDGPLAEHPGVRVHRSAVEGPPLKVLLSRSADVDLVIVGAHRKAGHFGLQLGCVAHALLHHADCPVAIVPQPQ